MPGVQVGKEELRRKVWCKVTQAAGVFAGGVEYSIDTEERPFCDSLICPGEPKETVHKDSVIIKHARDANGHLTHVCHFEEIP